MDSNWTKIFKRLIILNKFWNKKHPLALLMAIIEVIKSAMMRTWDVINSNLWRYNFNKFGNNSRVLGNVTIRFPGNIEIGNYTIIGRGVFLTSEMTDSILIIGDHTQLNTKVRIEFSGNVTIGSNVVISSDTQIYTHSHGYDPKSQPIGKPLSIGNNVWIGSGCYIMEQKRPK